MDRGLKAAFLFSLLVVAQADRALHAHKPATGGLHAVAVLRSTVDTTTLPSTLADESTFVSIGNYMITNGNGTWTYSYYANNGNLNGNDAGMGGDYDFASFNPAWFNSNAATGSAGLAAFHLALAATSAASYDDTTTANGVAASTQIEAPVALYTTGLTSMVFTGAKTGVAVGRFNGFQDQDELSFATTVATVIPASTGNQKLNILLTYDGATTWVRATGLPKVTQLDIATAFFEGTFGTTLTDAPYPSLTPGDLTSVFMASKSLGWAVGGNDVALALGMSTADTIGPIAADTTQNSFDITTAPEVPFGLVIMTQNGGSVWKTVPIYTSFATLNSLWKNNDPSLKTILSTLMPGILFGIQSDASGKHVYAVGSPSSQYSSSATAMVNLKDNVLPALSVQIKTFGTILYSGNSGMSWVQQTAPTLYSGKAPYTLFAVAVQKGTTAIAVGGSPAIKYGDKAAGTIIYTMNGGFSWTQSVYPQSTGSKAPVFTCVAHQPSIAGVQTVWVGGFTTRADAALEGLTVPTKAVDFYPVAAVTGFNPTTGLTPTIVSSGVARQKGQIYTILISKDGGKTFAAAPTSGMPTGFVVTSYTMASTNALQTDRSVYGITWDNANHGWIYGYGFIMSTQDGGATWVYETPADVGVITVTPKVVAIASVPTTY